MNKKFIIFGGIAILALSLMSFASAKASQAKILIDNLIFKISQIKRIRIENSKLKFELDITLENPTAQDFSASSGGMIKAKVFRVYRGNKLMVHGNFNNIQGINIPAGGAYTFPNIAVEIPLLEIGREILDIATQGGGITAVGNLLNGNIIKQLKGINWQNEVAKLRYEIDIEALGLIKTFKNSIV